MTDIIREGFEELEAAGYVSDYIEIQHFDDDRPSIMRPAFNLESCMSCGYGRGTKLRFLNEHGYDSEREHALEVIGDSIVTVKTCSVGHSSTSYRFEEFDGPWNSVMFEKIDA